MILSRYPSYGVYSYFFCAEYTLKHVDCKAGINYAEPWKWQATSHYVARNQTTVYAEPINNRKMIGSNICNFPIR